MNQIAKTLRMQTRANSSLDPSVALTLGPHPRADTFARGRWADQSATMSSGIRLHEGRTISSGVGLSPPRIQSASDATW